jgi:hypothetical protein
MSTKKLPPLSAFIAMSRDEIVANMWSSSYVDDFYFSQFTFGRFDAMGDNLNGNA